MNKSIKLKFAMGVIMLLAPLMTSSVVHAETIATIPESAQNAALSNVRDLVMYKLIDSCYSDLKENINVGNLGALSWASIFRSGNTKRDMPEYIFGSTMKSNKKLSCSQIMGGWTSFFGKQSWSGMGYKTSDIPVATNNGGGFGSKEEVINFLKLIGYEENTERQSGNSLEGYVCVWFTDGVTYGTDKLCAKPDEDNADNLDKSAKIKVVTMNTIDYGSAFNDYGSQAVIYHFSASSESSNDGMEISFTKLKYATYDLNNQYVNLSVNDKYCDTNYINPELVHIVDACKKRTLKALLRLEVDQVDTFNDLANALGALLLTTKSTHTSIPDLTSSSGDKHTDGALNYMLTLKSNSRAQYMKYFMGDDYASFNRSLQPTEAYMLYWSGLKSDSGVLLSSNVLNNENVNGWLNGTSIETGYNLQCSGTCSITTIDSNGNITNLKALNGSNKDDASTVLGLLNSIVLQSESNNDDDDSYWDVEENDDHPYDETTQNYQEHSSNDSSNDSSLNACQKSGGVFSLGWWICPIINTLTNAAQDIYNKLLEPRLFIEPKLFTDNGGQNVTYNVWNDFRNFANIIFVIMILVIVFSQLTGVGIDNYGIKRTLPKLIVAAVLVNLSYIICQLCVDLSNIVGKGIFDTFVNLTKDIHFTISVGDDGNLTGAIIGTALIGAIAGFGVWSSLGIVGLFSVLVSSIVSLFFLFILLAAREAAIVVLTILSPLAFVCYMLPNTKQLFSKWMKLGEGLLLVYPISALLVAGGSYVAKLILNINVTTDNEAGFFTTLTAIVISIIPIFFIPTVLKNSFSALGNIGAKISGFGQRMGGGAAKAMRGTRLMRNLEKNQQSRREFRDVESAARRAQRTMARYGKRDRKTLSARQQQKLLEAEQTMGQYRAQRAKAAVGEAVVTEDYAKAEAEDQYNMKQGQINAGKVATTIEVAQAQAENENINRAATNTVGVARVTKKYAKAQAENEFNVRQAEYEHPAPIVAPDVANQRVESARQTQELKNYADQYATKDNGYISTELRDAVGEYKLNRNKENATRLQAAIAAAESRSMYDEMLNGATGLQELQLSGDNDLDTRILGQMAQSKDAILSTYAVARNKPANQTTAKSIDDFAKASAGTDDSLTDSLKNKGPAVLNTASDDSLKYILKTNSTAVDTKTAITGVQNNTSLKVRRQFNAILQDHRAKGYNDGYELSTEEFGKLDGDTYLSLRGDAYNRAKNEIKATRNTEATRRIINGMSRDLRSKIGL